MFSNRSKCGLKAVRQYLTHRKHCAELDVKTLPEDGHGQAGFHDGLAHAVIDALHLRLTQCAEEHLQGHVPLAVSPFPGSRVYGPSLSAKLETMESRAVSLGNAPDKSPSDSDAFRLGLQRKTCD